MAHTRRGFIRERLRRRWAQRAAGCCSGPQPEEQPTSERPSDTFIYFAAVLGMLTIIVIIASFIVRTR